VDVPDADARVARVLVPVDFSVCTLETLRYAKALAEKFDAVVDVLHVIQLSLGRNEAAMLRPGLIRTMSEGARQELKKLVGILWESEVEATVSVRVREGRAHEVILREACSTNASLIIMGTRNRSWLSGLLRRNTVKRVIQNSPCPVMVLRTGLMGSGANRNSRNGSSFMEGHYRVAHALRGLGEPGVNVLELNLVLDSMSSSK
jgi:nucleotide-binding universal stress UspA family protein